jgi:hypothetical protein
LTNYETSPYWYRGYFRDDLTQDDVNKGLRKFHAQKVIVGHTIQSEVNWSFEEKVIGIDVKHPKDYYQYFPQRKSQGLLIEGANYYRVFDDGSKELL